MLGGRTFPRKASGSPFNDSTIENGRFGQFVNHQFIFGAKGMRALIVRYVHGSRCANVNDLANG